MKILFAASEVVPFAKTGGLADVAGALPLALEDLGHEVIVAMPKYKCVSPAKFKIIKLSGDISYTLLGKNVKVYFIENNHYYDRENLYVDKGGDYPDNLERFAFYCRRSLDLLKEIGFQADIIHAHDWQGSLIPVYLKNLYSRQPFYSRMNTVLTIHNIGYQGIFPKEEFAKLGLDGNVFNPRELEFFGKINLLKGGIVYADIINTVSPTYSLEIRTREFGAGLEGVLEERKDKLFGVLNGLDYSIWDPGLDRFIAKNFSARNIEDKFYNKEDLQNLRGLAVNRDIPVLGIVSRLVSHKGFDILTQGLGQICHLGAQLVILGVGEEKYHQAFRQMAKTYPDAVSACFGFDDELAHKIYAGADIFLMPSSYEPCGLGQLISLRYGTIPLVFKTGGLADTVNQGNGFVFTEYSSEALVDILRKAIKAYKSKVKWRKLVAAAMNCDFSWGISVKKYNQLYAQAKAG